MKLNMTATKRLPIENVGTQDGESIPEGKGRFKNFIVFPTTTVPAGGNLMIRTNSYVPFRPRRLVVAPQCAPFFDINDFKAGNVSVCLNAGSVPATCFPPLPLDVESKKLCEEMEAFTLIHMPALGINHTLGLHVTNTSSEERRFQAMFWVDLADPPEQHVEI